MLPRNISSQFSAPRASDRDKPCCEAGSHFLCNNKCLGWPISLEGFPQDNGEGTSSRQGRPFLAAAEIDALPSNRNGALAWPAGAIRLKAHLFLTVVLDVLDVRDARGGLPSLLVPERIGFLLQ